MPLFKNISSVRNYFKGANYANSDSSLPSELIAKTQYLLPILGNTLYADLEKYADNATLPSQPYMSEADFKKLYEVARTAMAYLMYATNLSSIHTRITDKGIDKVSTTNEQPVFRWEYNELKEFLIENAAAAIEELFILLHRLDADHDLATMLTDLFPNRVKHLINSAAEFKQLYPLTYQPYRTYNAMLPIMSDVEDLYFIESLTVDFYNYLKNYTGTDVVVLDAIKLLKKSMVHYTIYRACTSLYIRISNAGFTVHMDNQASDDAQQNANAASDNAVIALQRDRLQDASTYLTRLLAHCNKHASTILLPLWFTSGKYVNPTAANSYKPCEQSGGIFMM